MHSKIDHVKLADISELSSESRRCVHQFLEDRQIAELHWPTDVVEQWLFDNCANHAFITDYGSLELEFLSWRVEVIPRDDFLTMPTGPSDEGCIDEYARVPQHWVESRKYGIHMGTAEMWETHGTWKRWPLLIDRQILGFEGSGLQVIEGRTRVGVLRGRHRDGAFVAPNHLAWVARIAMHL